ncbi:hypothetical protein GUITHDRAFT_145955 [Guillardia theta CCMP2712]|uniref:TNFR-Cys domain-containing protein n=1 Tax=Guillardia theta (strain CCMP2712) TaxID=905079 RepID=L1IIP3_GUITC|nr:hypothetical protein GUITHDRAFT_145955 [Guillardia theta CCMP2712]EKX36133.1 hypothetical protein GUITHDRAFT_145955 [Guillardia theta CCMP2712]|eukprot:XP_005823113.1 hypothetical protein GUITHDRAFT_145955 [Guillardia theta CCMP2712]
MGKWLKIKDETGIPKEDLEKLHALESNIEELNQAVIKLLYSSTVSTRKKKLEYIICFFQTLLNVLQLEKIFPMRYTLIDSDNFRNSLEVRVDCMKIVDIHMQNCAPIMMSFFDGITNVDNDDGTAQINEVFDQFGQLLQTCKDLDDVFNEVHSKYQSTHTAYKTSIGDRTMFDKLKECISEITDKAAAAYFLSLSDQGMPTAVTAEGQRLIRWTGGDTHQLLRSSRGVRINERGILFIRADGIRTEGRFFPIGSTFISGNVSGVSPEIYPIAEVGCSSAGTGRIIVNPAGVYDVSVCDAIGERLDVLWDGERTYHRRMATPTWLYVVISLTSIYLVSCTAQNLSHLLFQDQQKTTTPVHPESYLRWTARAVEVGGVATTVGLSVGYTLAGSELVLNEEIAYAVVMIVYIAIHFAVLSYKVLTTDVRHRVAHFLTFNLNTGILLLLTQSVYKTLANPYVGILLVMLTLRSFYKLLELQVGRWAEGKDVRSDELACETLLLLFDATVVALTHYVGFRRSFLFPFEGDASFVVVCTGVVSISRSGLWELCGCAANYYRISGQNACGACTTCTGDNYQTGICISIYQTTCAACYQCSSNEYETTACRANGASTNRQCTTCRSGCGADTYQSKDCQEGAVTQNRVCTDCRGACETGKYQFRDCQEGGVTQNRVCNDCPVCDTVSGLVVEYRSGCTGTSSGTCTACTSCNGYQEGYGNQYTTGCSGINGPGTCDWCINRAQKCSATEWLKDCGGFNPGTCTSCTTATNKYCPEGQYRNPDYVCSRGLSDIECIDCACANPNEVKIGCGVDGADTSRAFSVGTCVPCPETCLSMGVYNQYVPNCGTSQVCQQGSSCRIANDGGYIYSTAYHVFDTVCAPKTASMLSQQYQSDGMTPTMTWIEHEYCMSPFERYCTVNRIIMTTIVSGGYAFAQCACRAGYYVKYQSKDALTEEETNCLTYQGELLTAYYMCARCPSHTYSTDYDIGCKFCPLGQEPNQQQTACKDCPRGTKLQLLPDQGTNVVYVCVPCEPGTYQDGAPEIDYCKPCPFDQYSGYGESSCHYCDGATNHSIDSVHCVQSCGGFCEYWNSVTPYTKYSGDKVCPDREPTSTCVDCGSPVCAVLKQSPTHTVTDECKYCVALGFDSTTKQDVGQGLLFVNQSDVPGFSYLSCAALPFEVCNTAFRTELSNDPQYALFGRYDCQGFSRGEGNPTPRYGSCFDCYSLASTCLAGEYVASCQCSDTSAGTQAACTPQQHCQTCFPVVSPNAVIYKATERLSCQVTCQQGYTGISLEQVCTEPCGDAPTCSGVTFPIPCSPPRKAYCEECINTHTNIDGIIVGAGAYSMETNWIDKVSNSRIGSFENLMILKRAVAYENTLCVRGTKLSGRSTDPQVFLFPTRCYWDGDLTWQDNLQLLPLENRFVQPGTPQWETDAVAYAIPQNNNQMGDTVLFLKLFAGTKTLRIGALDLSSADGKINGWVVSFHYKTTQNAEARITLGNSLTITLQSQAIWDIAILTGFDYYSSSAVLSVGFTPIVWTDLYLDEFSVVPNFLYGAPTCNTADGIELCSGAQLNFPHEANLQEIYGEGTLPATLPFGVRQFHLVFTHAAIAGSLSVWMEVNDEKVPICTKDLSSSVSLRHICTLPVYLSWRGTAKYPLVTEGPPGLGTGSLHLTLHPMACSYRCLFSEYFFTNDRCVRCNTTCLPGSAFQGCNPDGTPICVTCAEALPAFASWLPNVCEYECFQGYYAANSSACLACPTSSCTVGQHRAECQAVVGAPCQECTTKRSTIAAYETFEEFITPGIPFDSDNCITQCAQGSYRREPNCLPCRTLPFAGWELRNSTPHRTLSCTQVQNALAVACVGLQHGRYTGYATGMDEDCPVVCDAGYYPATSEVAFTLPFWEAKTRADNRTFSERRFNLTVCNPCMETALSNGAYTAGCSYVCDVNYVKSPTASKPQNCIYCPGKACLPGEYQSGCHLQATCLPCTSLADPHREYTAEGLFEDSDSCPNQCSTSYWSPSALTNCTACTPEASLSCNLSSNYIQTCTPTSDASCRPCSVSCDPGYFTAAPCSDYADRVCDRCLNPLPQHARFLAECIVECIPDYVRHNASYCGFCDPRRVCGVGTYFDDCKASNSYEGCSLCRNGLEQNHSVLYLTSGEPYQPYSCTWRCAVGTVLGRNATGGLACVTRASDIIPTPAPLQTPPSSCPPGQYLSPQLLCEPCTNAIPPQYAIWTSGCTWICTPGRIAVQDPIQQRFTCMVYADYLDIVLNTRRVLIQNPFNDTYRPHVMGYSREATGLAAAGFACLVGFVGMALEGMKMKYEAVVTKKNLRRLWTEVAFGELLVLTQLAAAAFVMQYSVFFYLMFSKGGIRNFDAPYCQSLFYISDKLAVDKGTASLMVISGILSWVVLGIISSRNHLLLNRGVVTWLALLGYASTIAVVLYDNISDHGDVHLLGAGVLALTYIWAQLNYSLSVFEYGSISKFTAYATAALTCLCIVFFAAFGIVYIAFNNMADPCMSNVIILEYIVYLLISLNNIVIYTDFTAAHAYVKLCPKQYAHIVEYVVKDQDIPTGKPVMGGKGMARHV